MATTEFEQRLRKLALRKGMTIATFAGLGEADRAVRKDAWLRQAGGTGRPGAA